MSAGCCSRKTFTNYRCMRRSVPVPIRKRILTPSSTVEFKVTAAADTISKCEATTRSVGARTSSREVEDSSLPNMEYKAVLFSVIAAVCLPCIYSQNTVYFLKQCHKSDPNVNTCLQQSANYLVANMKRGIPEIGITEPEPIVIDNIGIALGSGPDGYRANFRNIKAFGVSNCTVTAVRSDVDTHQFQFTMYIPKISARAKYESSGILILVQASGGGDYWGEYEGIKVKVYIRASPQQDGGRTYLTLQQLKMDFSVKHIRMGVENIHNGNAVIQAALNLFINSNAQELLKEMKPQLKKKLLVLMRDFIENLFANVPYEAWMRQD